MPPSCNHTQALVFCNSRKTTALAAAGLAKTLGGALLQAGGAARRQRLQEASTRLRDPKLREYVQCGVRFHRWARACSPLCAGRSLTSPGCDHVYPGWRLQAVTVCTQVVVSRL